MPQAIVPSVVPRTRRTLVWTALVALVLSLWVPAAWASPAPDEAESTTVSWGVRPADTVQGAGRPNFVYEAPPGGMLSDAIIVTNRGAVPLTLDVYAADGFLTSDGSLDILPSAETSEELGSWITFGSDRIDVAPDQSVQVPFEVRVPEGTQPGDYAGGIVAAMRVEAVDGVTTERRLGSRVHMRVAGDLVPALTVTDVQVDYHGTANPVSAGSATVTFTLVNSGNARIAPSTNVRLSGPFGAAAVSTPVDVAQLLPGSELTQEVTVDGVLPLGLLSAVITAQGEVVQTSAATDDAAPAVPTAEGSAATAAVPWAALAVLLVIAGLVAWRVIARRRAKAAHQRAIDDAVAAALAASPPATDAAPAMASAPVTDTAGDAAETGPRQPQPEPSDSRAS